MYYKLFAEKSLYNKTKGQIDVITTYFNIRDKTVWNVIRIVSRLLCGIESCIRDGEDLFWIGRGG